MVLLQWLELLIPWAAILVCVMIARRACVYVDGRADDLREVGYWKGRRAGWGEGVEWCRRWGSPSDGLQITREEEPVGLPPGSVVPGPSASATDVACGSSPHSGR